MSKKISVIFISCLIFWLIFAPKSAILPDATISGWISNAIALFLLWYVRHDLKYILKKGNRSFNLLLLTYLAVAVYSVYYNADTISRFEFAPQKEGIEKLPQGITSIKYLLYYSIGIFASSLYIQRIASTKYIITLIKTFVILFLIILIPTYIEIVRTPIEKDVLTEYSVGNKFSIGYYHLYLCTLYYFLHPSLNSKKHKRYLLLFIALMIWSGYITQCSTMIVAAIVFLFLSFFTSRVFRNHLASANVIITTMLLLGLGFFFLASGFLQYGIVQNLVTDVLNRDATLTGRVSIFMEIQEAFSESPWIGLGYGNSIVVSYFFTGAYDSQNGLVELFIQVGVIGVAVFLSLVHTASKKFRKNYPFKYPYVAFLYAIFFISTVEIPYKLTFVFLLSLCFIQDKGYSSRVSNNKRPFLRR